MFNYEYPPIGGGGGVICKDIAEELVVLGNEVTVITSCYKGLEVYEKLNGVEIVRVKILNRSQQNVASLVSLLSYVPSSIRMANKILSKRKFDIINTHFAIPTGPAGQHISNKFNIPNVLSIHGGDIFDPSKSLSPHKTFGLKQTVKNILLRASRVVAQSTDTKQNALTLYGIKREIDIIPLGIKPNGFSSKSRNQLSVPKDKSIFITVGRLIKRKNIEELIDIFCEVRKVFSAHLLIIGDGPMRDILQQKIYSLNLQNEIKFLGRVTEEEKFQYLSLADVYVSTAMHEGFGIVFLEAMECGLPVVCYDRGGQGDFLRNEKTGYLISIGDKKSFVTDLLFLLSHPELKAKICSFNREYVRSFHINNIAKQYLELFKDTLNRSGN